MENSPYGSRPPAQAERIMAAFCHGSIILSLGGIIVPLVIWFVQKGKSPFVAFQAMQAIYLQAIRFVVMFLLACVILTAITAAPEWDTRSSEYQTLALLAQFVLPLSALDLVFYIYATIAVVMILVGRDFRYFLIAGWVDQLNNPG